MVLWNLEYFPTDGERNSPSDALKTLCTPEEQAGFNLKFRNLRELEYGQWNFGWLKQVRGFYQMRQGDFRAYFRLDKKTIVVVHVCRKVRPTALDEDISTAKTNWKRYERR